MEQIEIKTLAEAKKYLPRLAILQIVLAVSQGNTVTVVDEHRNCEYIFRPTKEDYNT